MLLLHGGETENYAVIRIIWVRKTLKTGFAEKRFPSIYLYLVLYIYTYIYMIYILSKSIECSQLDRLHPCREVEPR